MRGFMSILSTIINWMHDTTAITLEVGEFSAPVTFLQVFIGLAVVSIGITFLHKVFDW